MRGVSKDLLKIWSKQSTFASTHRLCYAHGLRNEITSRHWPSPWWPTCCYILDGQLVLAHGHGNRSSSSESIACSSSADEPGSSGSHSKHSPFVTSSRRYYRHIDRYAVDSWITGGLLLTGDNAERAASWRSSGEPGVSLSRTKGRPSCSPLEHPCSGDWGGGGFLLLLLSLFTLVGIRDSARIRTKMGHLLGEVRHSTARGSESTMTISSHPGWVNVSHLLPDGRLTSFSASSICQTNRMNGRNKAVLRAIPSGAARGRVRLLQRRLKRVSLPPAWYRWS